MQLQPRLPLGERRLADSGRQPDQPYLTALLGDASGLLLIVGTASCVLLKRRATAWKSGPLWSVGTVAVTPVTPTSVGLDPNLQGRTIAVIGVGSIGGRLAQLLAAGGASRLTLIDPDYLDLRNIRRHVCRINQIGLPKPQAVRSLLAQAGFGVAVDPIQASLPRNDSPAIRAKLASCDILVSCAASGPAQHYVNHLAHHIGRPAVIASVKLMPQSLGEIVHCLPASPGCLNCWRLELETAGLMLRENTHDPADYPGQTAETPQGLPAYLLDQLASVACNLVSRSAIETEGRVWLQALERPVDNFDDLRPQEPRFSPLSPTSKCLVCRGR
jgi:hypothetical protein